MEKRTNLGRARFLPGRLHDGWRALAVISLAAALFGCVSAGMAAPKEAELEATSAASRPMPAREARAEEPLSDRDGDNLRDAEDKGSGEFGAKADAASSPPAPSPPPPPQSPSQAAGGAKPAPASGSPASIGQASSAVVSAHQPMLIYSAQITMAVFEVNNGLSQVEELGRDVGGFLSKRDDTSISIRVPVARFAEVVQRIEKMGDMLHRNVSVEDVTEEFLDIEVRIKNARAVRDRLEQLLQKAMKVEESVILERELARVTKELEQMEGRIKFLKDRAAFSTVTVTFEARRQENVSSAFHLPVPWLGELGLSRLLSL